MWRVGARGRVRHRRGRSRRRAVRPTRSARSTVCTCCVLRVELGSTPTISSSYAKTDARAASLRGVHTVRSCPARCVAAGLLSVCLYRDVRFRLPLNTQRNACNHRVLGLRVEQLRPPRLRAVRCAYCARQRDPARQRASTHPTPPGRLSNQTAMGWTKNVRSSRAVAGRRGLRRWGPASFRPPTPPPLRS